MFTPGCVLWLAYPGNCDGPPGVCMAMPERDLAKGVTPVLGSTDRCFSRRFNGKLLMPDVSPVSSKTGGGERQVRESEGCQQQTSFFKYDITELKRATR